MSEGLRRPRRLDQRTVFIGIDLLTPQIADQYVSALAGKRQSNRATCAVRRPNRGRAGSPDACSGSSRDIGSHLRSVARFDGSVCNA